MSSMQLPAHELAVVRAIHDMLQAEEQRITDQPYLEGLRNLLGQPEFSSADRMLAILDLLEDPLTRLHLFDPLWDTDNLDQGPQVKIGRENNGEIGGLENLSIVIASYGVPGEALGALAVVGPTRMAYPRVLATVHFLADLMTKLLQHQLR
ncbi:MAG: hypothetical protein NTZ05_02460 [Chloroflexi bacterium]|nr:hypothetical protein [Chloroflexota bacterium]